MERGTSNFFCSEFLHAWGQAQPPLFALPPWRFFEACPHFMHSPSLHRASPFIGNLFFLHCFATITTYSGLIYQPCKFRKTHGHLSDVMLGVAVFFDKKVAIALRLLCVTDVLLEIVHASSSSQIVPLDSLIEE